MSTDQSIQSFQTFHEKLVPRKPSRCPLFCAFYAEFDNKVGPRVCFSSPERFMEMDIDSPVDLLQTRLQAAFDKIRAGEQKSEKDEDSSKEQDDSIEHADLDETNDDDIFSEDGVDVADSSNAIFDSCSEYIITGNELTGQTINLSTHHIHVLTRPTMISDERYERNALLFCIGFVLRRTEDPRPFRPVLSKFALTLRDMEIESQFLSSSSTRPQIQSLLEHVLTSLNSSKYESNMIATSANALNLKLFNPPRSRAHHVADHEVPLLLRRDWQIQGHEWDLAINWVSLFIDGTTNVIEISNKAEVDLEMVRACLRVLKYHGVIKLVDMFFFSNHYESTSKAAALLTGSNPKLLNEAAEYVVKRMFLAGHDASPSLSSQNLNSYRSPREHMPTLRLRPDHGEIKDAIAELYSSLQRSKSLQQLWASLLTVERKKIDWVKIFDMIDHRRFVSFGQVHGLIQRIHLYPMRRTKRNSLVEERLMRFKALSLMNGKNCDDAICCALSLSIGEILDLVSDDDVMLLYSP